jgi:hypothetical protein
VNIEFALAVIGAITVVLVLALGGFVGVTTVIGRLRTGDWWWNEAGDALEGRRG